MFVSSLSHKQPPLVNLVSRVPSDLQRREQKEKRLDIDLQRNLFRRERGGGEEAAAAAASWPGCTVAHRTLYSLCKFVQVTM